MGTPGFAAPEQYGKGQTDARSDIYSLGVTLHHLLTGYDPAQSPFMLPPVRSLNPALSPAIAQLIQQATQLNPDQRYPAVAGLRAALHPAPSQPTQRLRPPDVPLRVYFTRQLDQASISWLAPASTGSSPLTEYRVEVNPGGQLVTVNPQTTSTNIGRLRPE